MSDPDYSDQNVQAALARFQSLDNDQRRAFYWALQNPTRSGLNQLQAAPEVDVSDESEPASASNSLTGGVDDFLALLANLKGRSIMTGIEALDASIAGLERQTLTILAARPSIGKTTLAWQIARNVAAGGLRALFLSLEVSRASLYAKAVCGSAGLRWRDIRLSGYREGVADDVISYLSHYAEELQGNMADRLLVDEHKHTTKTIAALVETGKPDLVVVDHLRLVADKGDSEVRRLGEISYTLKMLAKEHNCAMLIASQLNRNLEARAGADKRPTLADLRDSGEIEENADLVLMMHRDREAPAGKDADTEILVRKYRDDIGNQMIRLTFDLKQQWFVSGGGMKP